MTSRGQDKRLIRSIHAAIRRLLAADEKRGIRTRLVALDSTAAMKKLSAPVVTDATDPEQNKSAIDGVFKKLVPEYLVMLGAVDVVPHQDLEQLVGKRLRCTGALTGYTFLMSEFAELGDEP